MNIRKSLLFFLLGINIVFAFALLLSCIAPFVSPANFWLLAFFGLSFPVFLLGNIFWFIFWVVLRKLYSLISLIVILASGYNLFNQTSIASCFEGNDVRDHFTLMSYNVQTFGLYKWTHNEQIKDQMLELIKVENTDVVCFQEFYTDDSEKFNIIERLSKIYPYFQFQKTLTLREHEHWGIATFSKYPIVNTEVIAFQNSKHNLAIASDIALKKDTIRVFNAHLQSIHFGKSDYEGVKNLGIKDGKENFPVVSIFSKLKDAFIKRADQADILKGVVDSSSRKIILCADFNDSPNSYTYYRMSKDLSDTFKEAGCGLGRTYSGPFPSFRIDQILCDKSIEVSSHEVIRNPVSDHFPVVASFNLK